MTHTFRTRRTSKPSTTRAGGRGRGIVVARGASPRRVANVLGSVLLPVVLATVGVLGCRDDEGSALERSGSARTDGRPDARLVVHAVEPSTPTEAGITYVQALAEAHARADATKDAAARREILSAALDLPAPAGLTEAEIFELELAARLAETHRELGEDDAALAVLSPRLAVDRSLPRAPETAHALVVLGDVAHALGDDALAAGSYARALRLLAQLRREVEEDQP
jgi:hypothetical protein